MSRLLLSEASDWHLTFPDEQDVRGFRVLDAERNDTGRTVRDMVIDTDAERVSHVVFSDGTEYPARDLSIGDGVVYATTDVSGDARRASDMADFGRVRQRSDAERFNDPLATEALASDIGPMDDDAAYQAHFATTYAASGRPYDDYRTAYRYGRDACLRYSNRGFSDAEPSIRTDYEQRHGGDSLWDDVKDAVRHGYERARAAVT